MKLKRLSLFILIIFGVGNLNAQEDTFSYLEGHWEGAFIRSNSYQKFEIQFYKKDTAYYSLQTIREWFPQFGEFELPVAIDSTGTIKTNTGHGKAILTLDKNNLELVGYLEGKVPAINVHLKKVPDPPAPSYEVEEVSISNGDVSLYGHLHRPKNSTSKSAIILVGGRSCYAGSTKYDLYANVLREYGLSVLVFNKRGTGKSTGDCSVATIEDLASDVRACKRFLENHPSNYSKIGVLGSSAGGWVMVKAEEKTDFDFMISVVGPSTSVREQQMQSLNYGVDFYKLSETARTQLTNYTNLLFDIPADKPGYDKLQYLLQNAEKEDWRKLLDDTDIAASPEGINNLWVRRHNYDPKNELSRFNKPFLGIYGQIDWIVPYEENISRLKELFSGKRSELLTTVVAHNAEHGTEVKDEYIVLPNEQSYWHFFRISPQVLVEIVDFLKSNEIIE